MTDSSASGRQGRADGVTVDFGKRYAGSKQFSDVFQEGMGLVEETAAYLDGQGRDDAKGLNRHAAIAYASESMRLTTRLMQLASWLLLQRAVNEGEMSLEDAAREKHRVNLDSVRPSDDGATVDTLPEALSSLITRSNRLYDRILKLDVLLNEERSDIPTKPKGPLQDQLGRLQQAFETNKDSA